MKMEANINELKNRTKHAFSLNDPDLKRLFSALFQNSALDFCKLAQWIGFFKENPYDVKAELL